MDEMSKTIMDIQEYFDNETQRHVSEEGALAIDRYTGTIDFAVRVYEYGRMHVSDDPASYLNYTKIAMDNLMEFLSVNYPKITNPKYKSEIDAHVQKFLTYMAIELHSFIKKYYETWQKSYPYVFRNFTKVHEKVSLHSIPFIQPMIGMQREWIPLPTRIGKDLTIIRSSIMIASLTITSLV